MNMAEYKAMLITSVPEEMQNARRWNGTHIDRDGRKLPVNLSKGNFKEWQKDLLTMQEAMEYLDQPLNGGTYVDALCFVISEGCGWYAIDLDNHDNVPIPEELLEATKALHGAYREKSYNGKGIHIFGKYSGEKLNPAEPKDGAYKGKIEIYAASANHPMMVTGKSIESDPPAVVPDHTEAVKEIHLLYVAPKQAEKAASSNSSFTEGWTDEQHRTYMQENINDILAHIDPSTPRKEWVTVGAALHYEGFSIDLFEEWSKRGTNYKNRHDVETTWRTFSDGKANPATGATLIHLAKDGGWNPPRPSWAENSTGNFIESYTGKKPAAIKPGDFSDAGNAEVFARRNEGQVLWCSSLGWLVWNGQNWENSEEDAQALALQLSKEMLEDAFREYRSSQGISENGSVTISDGAKAYLKHASRLTRSRGGISNFMALSKSALNIKATALDANPYTLNTPGGLVDLKTGEIRPATPADLCTHITSCSPSQDGKELWESFLQLVTSNDSELENYLQYAVGASIIGRPIEGVWLAVGGGRNGKSTFYNAISSVLGTYAGSIDSTVLTTEKQNRGSALATLRGLRFVTCGELEEGQRLSVQTLKRLASTDKLTIERKYMEPETIDQTHHISLFSNFLPRVGSTDEGTWRRLWVIPFNATMPEGAADIANYAQVLHDEAGGAILSWAIEGARLFIKSRSHLPRCEAVMAASGAYRDSENWISIFISECCTIESTAQVSAGNLYDAYKFFAKSSGEFLRRRSDFTAAMEIAGYKHSMVKGGRIMWYGLRINDDFHISPITP